MLECKVCGYKFNPVKQNHYIVRDNEKSSLIATFSSNTEPTLHDAFDCPQCGCQIVAQQRKRAYITGYGEKQFDLKSNWEDCDEDDKDGDKL